MFEELINQKVSVLFSGLKGNESWVGLVKSISNDFIVLDVKLNSSNGFKSGYIKTESIISVLVYSSSE